MSLIRTLTMWKRMYWHTYLLQLLFCISLQSRFIEECQWSAHEEALALCSNQRLHQTVYFLNRDLTFMREVIVCAFFIKLCTVSHNYIQLCCSWLKRKERKGSWIYLHNEELHNLFLLPDARRNEKCE